MFKLVVLCAFFAAAASKPSALLYQAPITQYSYLAPATTTITKQDSSVIHPSPIQYYAAGPLYTHFIKKRSPQFTYYAPTTYISPAHYVPTTPLHTPLIQSASILPAVAHLQPALHLIKKRSVSLLPTSYYPAHPYSAPILTTSYAATAPIIPSAHLIPQPITYTHFIKKRSAPLLNTFLAPTSYSHQSRFDLQSTHTPLTSVAYSTPYAYTSPFGYSHVY